MASLYNSASSVLQSSSQLAISDVHADLSLQRSRSNFSVILPMKSLSFPRVPLKSRTVGIKRVLTPRPFRVTITTANSLDQHPNSLEYWGNASSGYRCWEYSEVGNNNSLDQTSSTNNITVTEYHWVADNILDSSKLRICVFCGSSCSEKKRVYIDVAEQLGTELVKRGIDLVYGGGSVGLMKKVAKTVQNADGRVVGVIPRALMQKGVCGNKIGELVSVDDMHLRIWLPLMARRADAFIALPGGLGTLDEVLEMITWAQLGIPKKPIGLLNVNSFYDPILGCFDNVLSAPTAAQLLDKLEAYTLTVD